jgi:hypothetical protein
MVRLVTFRRHRDKLHTDASIPVWPLALIVLLACLLAAVIADGIDHKVLSPFAF